MEPHVPVAELPEPAERSPRGLSSEEARRRLAEHGPNTVGAPRRHRALRLLLTQFTSPIVLILIAATVVSMLLGDLTDGLVILVIIAASGLLGFFQERTAGRAVDALLARVRVEVEVVRDGSEVSVPSEDVVPGDLVVLRAGDVIPADCRVVESHGLQVDESALTGESFPVEKSPGPPSSQAAPGEAVAGRTGTLFAGTHVAGGSGAAEVLRTGGDTEFGALTAELAARDVTTGFERGLTRFGMMLVRVMAVLVCLIFAVNLLLDRPVVEAVLFSLALAVGLTPQLLPAIVAVSLSSGARRMAAEQVIVKRLDAIEDFGAMTVLCTDKTGTLTGGVVRLDGAYDVDGRDSAEVLRLAGLNAGLQHGFANPLDQAILRGTPPPDPSARLDEVPYDFERRRISVLALDGGVPTLVTKGALEEVLGVCAFARAGGAVVPVESVRAAVLRRLAELSAAGYRVLGLATAELPGRERVSAADEAGMTLTGLLAFRDPPKEGAAEAVAELGALGVSVRLVTGDNRLAAEHVAGEVGLAGPALTGAEIDRLDDAALTARARDTQVFAEIAPLQKERVVRALRAAGETVGFLGDGINDSPALHAADVGISVDTAVDVAKRSAAIVLLDKNLGVVADGVRLGRQTFANTLKYVRVTTSANFGNMASMAAAAAFLPFLPLLPRQILLLNFLSDIPATTIAADAVDEEQVERPSAWDLRRIRAFMIGFGVLSSLFDVATFLVLRLGFDAGADLFRTGWFIESTATELAVMLVLRTRRPFFRSRPGRALVWSSVLVALVTVAVPFTPLAGPLGLVAPPPAVLAALAGLTLLYVAVNEAAKRFLPVT
ncbi:magnesium-translocating P-type ATPase [Nonomuraea pusilla]|uniref:Magnesium-transporting ATPase, P-type 1 n=1 Tax=Nonomuraea pusilla TaxID=46177 RepID=A0A1H8H6Z4_9ACTN|nr:magnesium-translocating P-type ATPase [Nonomuraea pusilla]SEN52033.1 Mg2+-importing ATPase [Nonomuraea pusilla]